MLTVVNVEAERVSKTETRIDPSKTKEIDRDIAAVLVDFICYNVQYGYVVWLLVLLILYEQL